jgi:multisubunit Na+/H+ antiporter MnhC subunit
MLGKILSSTWFALLVMVVAAIGLYLLHMKGRTSEAIAGAALLAVAALLIFLGRERKDSDRDY